MPGTDTRKGFDDVNKLETPEFSARRRIALAPKLPPPADAEKTGLRLWMLGSNIEQLKYPDC